MSVLVHKKEQNFLGQDNFFAWQNAVDTFQSQ